MPDIRPMKEAVQCFYAADPEITRKLGLLLGQHAIAGDIYTMAGSLGAGKTTLTQAIALGLDVPANCYVTSPTFSLIHEYPGRVPLYHIDLYRLQDEEECEELGLDDYLYGEGLTVIEWPDRLGDAMPLHRLHIDIESSADTARRFHFTAHGKWQERWPELSARIDRLLKNSDA